MPDDDGHLDYLTDPDSYFFISDEDEAELDITEFYIRKLFQLDLTPDNFDFPFVEEWKKKMDEEFNRVHNDLFFGTWKNDESAQTDLDAESLEKMIRQFKERFPDRERDEPRFHFYSGQFSHCSIEPITPFITCPKCNAGTMRHDGKMLYCSNWIECDNTSKTDE